MRSSICGLILHPGFLQAPRHGGGASLRDRGVRINVFFDHVMEHLRNHPPPPAHPGHVLAHEIGHVLLRVNAHGDTGLMKPGWTLSNTMPWH